MRRLAHWCVAALLLSCTVAMGQVDTEKVSSDDSINASQHLGYPHDWSSRHLLMPGVDAEDILAAGERDPRHVYNMVMRQVAIEHLYPRIPVRPHRHAKIDWAVSLENGYVPQNQFPAKYQFGVTSEDCNADYVVLGLTVTSGTQANLVGINNLYTSATPACNSGSPWVAFAYNTVTQTGGQIKSGIALILFHRATVRRQMLPSNSTWTPRALSAARPSKGRVSPKLYAQLL